MNAVIHYTPRECRHLGDSSPNAILITCNSHPRATDKEPQVNHNLPTCLKIIQKLTQLLRMWRYRARTPGLVRLYRRRPGPPSQGSVRKPLSLGRSVTSALPGQAALEGFTHTRKARLVF